MTETGARVPRAASTRRSARKWSPLYGLAMIVLASSIAHSSPVCDETDLKPTPAKIAAMLTRIVALEAVLASEAAPTTSMGVIRAFTLKYSLYCARTALQRGNVRIEGSPLTRAGHTTRKGPDRIICSGDCIAMTEKKWCPPPPTTPPTSYPDGPAGGLEVLIHEATHQGQPEQDCEDPGWKRSTPEQWLWYLDRYLDEVEAARAAAMAGGLIGGNTGMTPEEMAKYKLDRCSEADGYWRMLEWALKGWGKASGKAAGDPEYDEKAARIEASKKRFNEAKNTYCVVAD